jgi:acyl dehydratase
MNIQDLYIGQNYTLEKTFQENDVIEFSKLSMDDNPIHIDEEYASTTIFRRRIVHGFLVSSLFSAIIGTKMPGNGSIYLNQTMNFRKPVFLEQKVIAKVSILSINVEKQVIELETNCYDINGNILINGSALIKLI